MARFRGTMRGNRGPTSRLGTKQRGLTTTVNGWDMGITVIAGVSQQTGKDIFYIYQTGGSNARAKQSLLLTIEEDE